MSILHDSNFSLTQELTKNKHRGTANEKYFFPLNFFRSNYYDVLPRLGLPRLRSGRRPPPLHPLSAVALDRTDWGLHSARGQG